MEKETAIAEEFRGNAATYFAERIEYSSAHALCLFWQENDISPEDEVNELKNLFETELKYTTSEFRIPIDGTQLWKLNLELTLLIQNHCSRPDALAIVYYAGHCDADKGEARWAAFEEPSEEHGDPTLSWSVPQQLLYAASGDVLLILDCCNAALIKGGEKTQGKFELLAASAKGVKTPLPGKSSFTSRLIRTLRKHLNDTGSATPRDLCYALMTDKMLTETPIHTDFARNVPTGITLQRLRAPQHQGFIPKPSSVVMFRASLTGDPTGLQIAQWLKTCPPKNVTAVDIEAVVLKARRLQGLVDENAFPEKSIFRKLSTSAQQEILRQLRGLNSVVAASSACAGTEILHSDGESIEAHHSQIQAHVSAVTTAIETPVMLEMESADLKEAGEDTEMKVTGNETLSLRQYLLGIKAIRNDLEIPRSDIKLNDKQHRMRLGTIRDRNMLAEFFKYISDPSTGMPFQVTVDQIRKMCNLLCQPKRTSFHILPCVGYVHNKSEHSFGLIFEPPSGADDLMLPISLPDLYKRNKFVPLGHRIQLACALTVALENFHRVGWVHKALKPGNIFFWPERWPGKGGGVTEAPGTTCVIDGMDFAKPYLFGFEYARAEAAGTKLAEDHSLQNNLYRHPDRWSRPREKFIKAHDVYSLGIILLELALWRDVGSILKREPELPQEVYTEIAKRCKETLPHQAGKLFAHTIAACLNFEQHTADMTEYEMQRYFQTEVKEKFEKAVGRI